MYPNCYKQGAFTINDRGIITFCKNQVSILIMMQVALHINQQDLCFEEQSKVLSFRYTAIQSWKLTTYVESWMPSQFQVLVLFLVQWVNILSRLQLLKQKLFCTYLNNQYNFF